MSYIAGHHNVKIGWQVMQTHLGEDLNLGITDFTFNPVCVNRPVSSATADRSNLSQCAARGFMANPDFNPGLLGLDLTRGGSPFQFAAGNVNTYAGYIQDAITVGNLTEPRNSHRSLRWLVRQRHDGWTALGSFLSGTPTVRSFAPGMPGRWRRRITKTFWWRRVPPPLL